MQLNISLNSSMTDRFNDMYSDLKANDLKANDLTKLKLAKRALVEFLENYESKKAELNQKQKRLDELMRTNPNPTHNDLIDKLGEEFSIKLDVNGRWVVNA